MGVVYEVLDPRLGRPLALKLIKQGKASATAEARFWKEAEALAQIRHPNVVAIHEVGRLEGDSYMVMDRVEGRPSRT